MVTAREISDFSNTRTQARAYMCYLFTRNIPNNMPEITIDTIVNGLKKLKKELYSIEVSYILDPSGHQIENNFSKTATYRTGKGLNRSNRAYYYRAAREKKCILTDPYPSGLTKELTVTTAYPIYDDQKHLKYIACIDISLNDLLKVVQPTTLTITFQSFSKVIYGVFSFALLIVSMLLLYEGATSISIQKFDFESVHIEHMFESTILLTLALAIFDLVKAIFEEEVLGKNTKDSHSELNKTMTRFLGSIIIALAIEALMLVFKFALIGPDKLIYAIYLIFGVSMLLISLSLYLKFTHSIKDEN